MAWNAWKRCCKRVDSQGEDFKGIHDRFLRDQVYRESQLAICWTEQKCIEMDELAKQNHTYRLSEDEFKKTRRTLVSHLEQVRQERACATSTRFSSCSLSLKNCLHRESCKEITEPISPQQYKRWHSFSSDSWWDTSKSWWSSL